MSIAAANLFTRNIYREFIRPDCDPRTESRMAKTMSLVAKLGALLFIILLRKEYAINMQLLGGIWIIQTFPAMILGLYTRWLDPKALLAGWAVGMISGTLMAWSVGFTPIFRLEIFGTVIPAYIAIYSVLLNFAVSFALSFVFNASPTRTDETIPTDYAVETGPGWATNIPHHGATHTTTRLGAVIECFFVEPNRSASRLTLYREPREAFTRSTYSLRTRRTPSA
jgi:SSS family solute:Na+ symporter